AKCLAPVQRSPPVAQAIRERPALDVLHDDVGTVLVHADVEHLDDIRVIEPGGEASLAREALAHLVIPGEVVGEQLDRDLAVELEVAGAIDRGHPSVAEPVLELVAVTSEPALHPGSPSSFALPGGSFPPWPGGFGFLSLPCLFSPSCFFFSGSGGGGGGGQFTWSTRLPATSSTPGRMEAGRSDSSTAERRSSAAWAA